MFAVPGWSVPADTLETQRDPTSKESKKAKKAEVSDNPEAPVEVTKKRKRGPRKAGGVDVTGDNFAELWEKHIEKRPAIKAVGNGELRDNKRRKKDIKAEEGAVVPVNGDDEEQRGREEGKKERKERKERFEKRKTLKEKKRERKALLEANGGHLPKSNGPDEEPPTTATKTKPPQQSLPTATGNPDTAPTKAIPAALPAPPPNAGLTPLQSSMRQKLISSRFRYLNQTLYTTPSTSSFDLFAQNPDFFNEYHEGFRRQVNVWPENPVDGFVTWIRERGTIGNIGSLKSQKSQFHKVGKGKKQNGGDTGMSQEDLSKPEETPQTIKPLEPLPRNLRTRICTIADLGCGEAQLAQTLSTASASSSKIPASKFLNLRFHSFDLAAPNPLITIADMRAVPLEDSSIDVAIFCLALMGTNWLDFIEEAYRLLRWKGECWIGEVGSRFAGTARERKRVEHSVGNKSKKGKTARSKNPANDQDSDAAATTIFAEEENPDVTAFAQGSTDVKPFVEVMRRRGFVLVGDPELGNKMFVRMRFLKALMPMRGKGFVVSDKEKEREAGRKRFVEIERGREEGEEMSVEEEARVLKPCVYKLR